MMQDVIDLLKKYCDGKSNADRVEMCVLQMRRIIRALEKCNPCDLCRYAPASSADGKPCTMCPAEGRDEE